MRAREKAETEAMEVVYGTRTYGVLQGCSTSSSVSERKATGSACATSSFSPSHSLRRRPSDGDAVFPINTIIPMCSGGAAATAVLRREERASELVPAVAFLPAD
eukprot:4243273-Pleurochrysis_carterae.AAC.1